MAEKNYRVSALTKEKLINAAGLLFSQQGTENVTVRQITALAGTKENAISYHFGGKEGLARAVWEKAVRNFNTFSYANYLKDNANLLKTKKGQIEVITKIITEFYNSFIMNDEEADWMNVFIQKGAFCDCSVKYLKKVREDCWSDAIIKVFEKITGKSDIDTFQRWILFIGAPACFVASNREILGREYLPKKIDKDFYAKYAEDSIKYALFCVGLA